MKSKCTNCGKCCLSGPCTISNTIAKKIISQGHKLIKLRYPIGNYRPRKNNKGYCKFLQAYYDIETVSTDNFSIKYYCTLMQLSPEFKKSMLNNQPTDMCEK